MHCSMERNLISNLSFQIEKITENCNLPFSAGKDFDNFTSFLSNDVEDYFCNGDGVTYLIKNENTNDIIAYFCISASAIPFDYKIEGESSIWGVSVVEIRMFAVNEPYQDVFMKDSKGNEVPIAAWCLAYLIHQITEYIGTKAIYLHSVPTAEKFYKRNGFMEMNNAMIPLHCLDDNLKELWLPLQRIDFGDDVEK